MKTTATIPAELLTLLGEYEQFYRMTNEIVNVYNTARDLFNKKGGDDKEILWDCAIKLSEWVDLKKNFVKEVRTHLVNQFRAIRDSLNPADISGESLTVFDLIRRISCDIDNNILFLYGTLNI